jgi:hypothetical protein
MPYLAFDLDALNAAPNVARAGGISEDAAIAGLARMWAWCFREENDHVSPSHLAGFFGTGDADRVAAGLSTFGFLEQDGVQLRVRGADRYLKLKQARREGGRKGGQATVATGKSLANLKRPAEARAEAEPEAPPKLARSSNEALSPSTEHRTPNTKKQPPAAQRTQLLELEPQAAEEKKPRKRSDGQRFFDRCAELWHDVHPTAPREAEPDPRKLNSWFVEAVRDIDPERLFAAYCAYVRGKFKAEERHPFAVFMSAGVWRPRVPDEAPPPPEQCGCSGCSNPRGDRAGGRPVCNGHFAEWMAAYERDWPGGSDDFGAEHFATWLSRVAA